jgi:hypothetical protein
MERTSSGDDTGADDADDADAGFLAGVEQVFFARTCVPTGPLV